MDVPVVKTQGIILKKADLNEMDRFLTIYTEIFGKILVRAKGIGKKESKLKSLIEPFNIYEFMLARPVRNGASNGARSKNIDVLTNSYPIKEFLYLRQNLENLALAIYFSELVDKLVVAPERDENIWMLLTRAMEVLNTSTSVILRSASRRTEESPTNVGSKVPHTREILRRYTPQDDSLNKIKAAFEERLLGYLGHPTFAVRGQAELGQSHAQRGGKTSAREKTNYLESLAGEEIMATKFLKTLSVN